MKTLLTTVSILMVVSTSAFGASVEDLDVIKSRIEVAQITQESCVPIMEAFDAATDAAAMGDREACLEAVKKVKELLSL